MSGDIELEKSADDLLKSGTKVCNTMSDIPALYSIAISLKRIADTVEAALGILIDDEIDEGHDPYEQMMNQS